MSLPQGFTIRRASIDDVATLVAHRRGMFQDMGYRDQVALGSMAARFEAWLLPQINSGEYLAWLVLAPDGSIAAGTGLWLMDWPPHMIGAGQTPGKYSERVYRRSQFRRRGLARQLMETAIQWCRENGVDTIILHASPEGPPLYQSMGFAPTNEMRIRL